MSFLNPGAAPLTRQQAICRPPSALHGSLPPLPCRQLYLDGVLFKDAQLQEDVQLDLPLMEELFHLHLRVVQLLQDRLDVADGAAVGGLVVGHG